jgi:transcriptional regulator with PAS, ATPase and Fis domain
MIILLAFWTGSFEVWLDEIMTTKKIKIMMSSWVEGLPAAVTVTEADGTIVEMNPKSCETFAKDGGEELIGRSVFDCHHGEALSKTQRLYKDRKPNHYTIEKNGQKKIIHQLPWFQSGKFAGYVEISIPVPNELPHFDRND